MGPRLVPIDPAFEQLCLNFQHETSPTTLSPSSTPFSEGGSLPIGKLFAGKTSVVRTESDKDRLTKNYPNAWKDFYPSKAGCVYKSGPAWEVREGPEEQGIRREPRTVCRPDIVPVWSATLKKIISCLDDLGVDQTCINPFAWANEGDKKPFCPLLLTVGVRPESLAYQLAVSAAEAVKTILASIDFAEVEVAFQELEVSRHAGGLPPLSLNPVTDDVPEYRKAFSACLGVPIAPLSTPFLEGTGGLYLKINDDIVLLTCAHVVRPPSAFRTNSGMQHVSNSQAKEYVVALGTGGYSRAVGGMMTQIAKYTRDIGTFNTQLSLPNISVAKRTEIRAEITKLTAARGHLDTLHTEVTKFRSTPELRIFGWALYSSPIKVDAKVDGEELGYTQDWGLVQIDPKMLNLATFEGNKLYFGDKFTPGDLASLMWPNVEDRANYKEYANSLMQAWGVVPPEDISRQPHLDTNGMHTMFVMMNGGTSGTRLGRANGLFSAKRTLPEYGIDKVDSLEIGVIPYGKGSPPFSDKGDSGAGVFDRDGRVLGNVNGGAGPTNETDITFVSPFWWTLDRIHEVYPNARIYPVTSHN